MLPCILTILKVYFMKHFFLFLSFFFALNLTLASEPAPWQFPADELETLITQVEFSTRMIKKRSDLSPEAISSLSAQKAASIKELKTLLSELDTHFSNKASADNNDQDNAQRKETLIRMLELVTEIESSHRLEVCDELMILVDQLKEDVLGYNRHSCCEDPAHDHHSPHK